MALNSLVDGLKWSQPTPRPMMPKRPVQPGRSYTMALIPRGDGTFWTDGSRTNVYNPNAPRPVAPPRMPQPVINPQMQKAMVDQQMQKAMMDQQMQQNMINQRLSGMRQAFTR